MKAKKRTGLLICISTLGIAMTCFVVLNAKGKAVGKGPIRADTEASGPRLDGFGIIPAAAPIDQSEAQVSADILAPQELGDWHMMPKTDRLKMVNELMNRSDLSRETVQFFRGKVQDRDEDELLRNNMASLLVGQNEPDPTLGKMFSEMAVDLKETPLWRDYAVQFSGAAAAWATRPDEIAYVIWCIGRSEEGPISGTAMIQLYYMTRESVVPLPRGYEARIVEMISGKGFDIRSRITATSIAGISSLSSAIPALKTACRPREEMALRRAAVMAIRQISAKEEDDFISSIEKVPGDPISLAAESPIRKPKIFFSPTINAGLGLSQNPERGF